MEKFNSQICTTKEQSERLLALGLRRETADMSIVKSIMDGYIIIAFPPQFEHEFPAWSLHRLIEMTPSDMRGYMCENIFDEKYAIDEQFDELVATIGYYIKKGYFNKEYLEE